MHHSMRISMPNDISKNKQNPWKRMQPPDILNILRYIGRYDISSDKTDIIKFDDFVMTQKYLNLLSLQYKGIIVISRFYTETT